MGKTSEKTVGQLERELSQKIESLYRTQLGHKVSKVTCQLFGAKLAIVLEDSITQPEQLLVEEGKTDLVEEMHEDLSRAIQPQIKALIETVLSVETLDLMSDATLDTGRTGMIAVLANIPSVRNPEAIPKGKK